MLNTMIEPNRPFSEEELHLAFRLVLPEVEAREAATLLPEPTAEDLAMLLPGEHAVSGQNLTEDTLILMSLVSDELRIRVERYVVHRRGAGPMDADDQRAWQARRDEIRRVVAPRCQS